MWLDPTSPLESRNVFHLAGRKAMRLVEGQSEPFALPSLDPARNHGSVRIELRLEESEGQVKLSGSADLDLGGLYNPIVGFDRGQDRQRAAVQGLVTSLGNATIRDVRTAEQTSDATSLRVDFEGGTLEDPGNGLFQLAIPRPPGAILGDSLQLHREKRTLPLVLGAPSRETVEIIVNLPEEWEPAYVPAPDAATNAVGSFERTVKREGARLELRLDLKLLERIVAPGAYADLRALMAQVEGARLILLRRGSR